MVLTTASPYHLHVGQNLALIFTSMFFFPLSTLILLISYTLRPRLLFRYNVLPKIPSVPSNHPRISSTQRPKPEGQPYVLTTATPSHTKPWPPSDCRTVLVTGVGMTKGLHLARAFHLSHHRVIGADIAPYNLISPVGRLSRAIDRFYTLPAPTESVGSTDYIHALLTIIQCENASLWISCSGVATALDDARAKEIISLRSDCTCLQFNTQQTRLLHEKDTFTTHAASLGLPVPETYNVTSRAAVHKVLHQSPRTKKRFIMKSVNMDNTARKDIMTLLPRRTLSETYNHIARLPISESKPWVLQQYVPGDREYCTHALVVRGKVKAFAACPGSGLITHYEALPHPASALSRAMLRFTEEFAAKTQDRSTTGEFTGHLSFDFLVDELVTEQGVENVLKAIECNPRAHTAVVLLKAREREMVAGYLSAIEEEKGGKTAEEWNGHPPTAESKPRQESNSQYDSINPGTAHSLEDEIITPSPTVPRFYWIGYDIVTLLLLPLVQLFGFSTPVINLSTYLSDCRVFLGHVLFWQDGTYEVWDPLPAWWLYHVYLPGLFVASLLTGKRWSRVDVATCKVFGC